MTPFKICKFKRFIKLILIIPIFTLACCEYAMAKKGNEYILFGQITPDEGGYIDKPSKIYLIDSNKKIMFQWNVPTSFQLGRLLPSGNLLYSTRDRSFIKRAGLREIDTFGNILWYYPCRIDHDFEVLPNGNYLIHTIEGAPGTEHTARKTPKNPRIIEVNRDKQIVWEWNGQDHLKELGDLLGSKVSLNRSDWAHNNTVSVIGPNASAKSDPRFKEGNILFSYCRLNTIGVIDRKSNEIVWAWGPGQLDAQHSVQMLENGNLLLFDNGRRRGYSRVIEMNPLSNKIVWEYKTKNPKDLFSPTISGVQRLPNGHTFICSGEQNPITRKTEDKPTTTGWDKMVLLFFKPWDAQFTEVTSEGKVTWGYKNHFYEKNSYGVYRATQYSSEYLKPLFNRIENNIKKNNSNLKSLPYIA